MNAGQSQPARGYREDRVYYCQLWADYGNGHDIGGITVTDGLVGPVHFRYATRNVLSVHLNMLSPCMHRYPVCPAPPARQLLLNLWHMLRVLREQMRDACELLFSPTTDPDTP